LAFLSRAEVAQQVSRSAPRTRLFSCGGRKLELAQNHPDVDAMRFEMGKIEKVSAIGEARVRCNSDISCLPYDDLSAVGVIRRRTS